MYMYAEEDISDEVSRNDRLVWSLHLRSPVVNTCFTSALFQSFFLLSIVVISCMTALSCLLSHLEACRNQGGDLRAIISGSFVHHILLTFITPCWIHETSHSTIC